MEHNYTDPDHYRVNGINSIDFIEAVVDKAPTGSYAALQFSVLKYLVRMWDKDTPVKNLRKAEWLIGRMLAKLEASDGK